MPPSVPRVEEYDVGWICALHIEYVVACAMLDFENRVPPLPSDDPNAYTCGKIGDHLVVIACLPKGQYGLSSAASVATDMVRSFPYTTIRLMVGIAGGAPSIDHDIRLGDVVVGTPAGSHGGVVHYESGKTIQDQPFRQTGFLNAPPRHILNAVQRLDAVHERSGHNIKQTLRDIFEQYPRLRRKYAEPEGVTDVLFKSTFLHTKQTTGGCSLCISKSGSIVDRSERGEAQDCPVIHYGTIASADKLMKDAERRDSLAELWSVQCFEMEAAGLMNSFGCLVVRGICDYSDTHKNDEWQGYAAATAAAYAKELIQSMPASYSRNPRSTLIITETPDEMKGQEGRKRRRSDDQQTAEMICDTFHFRGMEDREYHIVEAEVGTFRWVIDGYSNGQPRFPMRRQVESQPSSDPIGLRTWLENGQGVFRIIGKPGCGKSTLMRLLASDRTCAKAIKSWAGPSKVLVAKYFAWRPGTAMQNTWTGFIRSLLHQVFLQDSELIDLVLTQYEKDQGIRNYQSRLSSNPEQWSREEINRFWTTFLELKNYKLCIFLDGLDEFDEAPHVTVQFVQRIVRITSQWIKIVISGRQDLFFDDFIVPSVRVLLHDWTRTDIETLARHTLQTSPLVTDADYFTPGELDNLIRRIVWKADGVFIWVKTVINVLLEGIHKADTLQELFRKLDTLPEDMTDLYRSILDRLSKEKLAEAATYFGFITELNMMDMRNRTLVMVLALEYESENSDWVIEKAQITHSELERRARKLERRVLSVCSHFVSLVDPHVNALDGQRFEYIHRTAYDFLSSKDAKAILRVADVENRGYRSILFLAQLVYEIIMCSGTPGIVPDAIHFFDALTNLNGDWEGEYTDPWLNEVDHPCYFSADNRSKFWTALTFWIQDAPPAKIMWESRDNQRAPSWWKVGFIKHRLEVNRTSNKDYLCLMTLALVGFNMFGHEAHFVGLSLPQTLDIFTADLIGRMGNYTVRPKLKNLLDRYGGITSDQKKVFTDILWYRILCCCRWLTQISQRFYGSTKLDEVDEVDGVDGANEGRDDVALWTRTTLEWMSTLVSAGADVNQFCQWNNHETLEDDEISALGVLVRFKSQCHWMYTVFYRQEYMPAIRQAFNKLEDEMIRKGAQIFIRSTKSVESIIPQDWLVTSPHVCLGLPYFDWYNTFKPCFPESKDIDTTSTADASSSTIQH